MSAPRIERREFLKFSLAAGGGLLIGFSLPGADMFATAQAQSTTVFMPNAFLRIGTDDRVTVIVNHSEMGQGVYTALPMLLAEELDADWNKIGFESAPVDPKYNHPVFGMQITGGSSSVWSAFEQYRKAGAAARGMLIAAAAQQWNVNPATLRTDSGAVFDGTNRKLTYGQLAEAAAKLTPPAEVTLKDPKTFKLIGKPVKRLDTSEKINGKAVFGLDVKMPGMLTAVVARPPIFGATMKSFDDSRARTMPGVRKIAAVPSGVAVIADSFWQAKMAREALHVDWDDSAMRTFSTNQMMQQFREQAKSPGTNVRREGDPDAAFAQAAKKIEAVYEVPYLPHAMMEPLNCAVDLRADTCEIWTGTQFQTVDRANAAKIAGLPPERVQIHTTYLGGGFGRRANPQSDFVVEAVHVAKVAGAPVKVVWTREDDMQGGWYRPAFLHAIAGSIDSNGNPVSWRSRLVGQSIFAGTMFEAMMKGKEYDPASVEGVDDLPYAIPNLAVESHKADVKVPVQWWRSVGHSHTGFATECFIDELAVLAQKDPYQFRRALLPKHPRHLAVLDLAAQKAGWGKPLPKGRARGIAVHFAFESYNAQVAEVSVDDGKIRVHRIVSAVDCGRYVNPGIIAAQLEGGAIFGASAALFQEFTFENGRLQQTNFHTFPMMRMNECPEIETHIVENNEKSGGIGEPGVPCTAPAIANAVFAATGKRIRKLPIRMTEAV
ncbi:MAG: twin-arginine translocation pathway signal protein [Acidobacteria bacterium]|nr:MAG: twin-arginine translocation pathway signal protein [Acidobacteriales bacterium 13_2_20CM_2_55_5]PYX01973.1 MAG: twin-arginine translocation pathway signal protein [Acidobacteriota bacterium]